MLNETAVARRMEILRTVGPRLASPAFQMFVDLNGIFGMRVMQRQVGLLKLAIYGDNRPGSITETYREVVEEDGASEIVTRTVTTDNEKMLLARSDGGWWEHIEPELRIEPLIHVDRCGTSFKSTAFDERLYRTVKSSTPWLLERVNGMPGYGGVAELDDRVIGRALGIVGGSLPHESHPVVAVSANFTAVRGRSDVSYVYAAAGEPPYDFSKVSGPSWLVMNPDGKFLVVGLPTLALGTYSFTFRVTDAMGDTADGVLNVKVAEESPSS